VTHKARVLELLRDGKPHSHMEGYRLGVMLHSRVADLRADGHVIECWHERGQYLYRLVSAVTEGRVPRASADSRPGTVGGNSVDDRPPVSPSVTAGPLTAPSVEPPQWASDGAVSGAHPEPQADGGVLAASTLGPSGSAPSQLALDVPRSAYREEAA